MSALLDHLDKRSRERELRRVLYYMRAELPQWRLLVWPTTHRQGQATLKQRSAYEITPTERWDKRWRVIIHDIPEAHKLPVIS